MIRTFETKLHLSWHIGVRLDAVFGEYAALMSRAEGLLLAQVKAGRGWTGDLKVSFYRQLGMSATHLDMAYRQLMAKLSSVAELAKENLKDATAKIASKKVDIRDGRTDAETFPVSTEISTRWLVPDNDKAGERKAFAFSAKKAWRSKIKSDVAAIAGTKIAFALIFLAKLC